MKTKILLVFAMSFGLSSLSQANDNNTLNVSPTYQTRVQIAWDKASEGELPVYECGSVVSAASKMVSEKKDKNNEAQQAYKACYVDVFLHYTDAFFDLRNNTKIGENNEPIGCALYTRYLNSYTTSLETYAERFDLSAEKLNKQILANLSEPASLCQNTFN